MKKHIAIFAMVLLAGWSAKGQTLSKVLHETDNTYLDIKTTGDSKYLAGLRHTWGDHTVDILLNNEKDLGHVAGSVTLPLSNNVYKRIEVVGNYAYALGYKMQPIKLTGGIPTLAGAEQAMWTGFVDCGKSGNNLYVAGYRGAGNYMYTVSLADPERPAITDSVSIGVYSRQMQIRDKTIYMVEGGGAGYSKVVTYHISATTPYVTMGATYLLTSKNANLSFDITGNQLVTIADSVYRFRILDNGDLAPLATISPAPVESYGIRGILAADAGTLCYGSDLSFRLFVQSVTSSITPVDTPIYNPAYFRSMGKLPGGNIFYTTDHSYLVHINIPATGISTEAVKTGLKIYPNPTGSNWNISSNEAGTLRIYSGDGKLMSNDYILVGGVHTIAANNLPTGIYYYSFSGDNKEVYSGILSKQ